MLAGKKAFGEKVARDIEAKLGLPRDWMDREEEDEELSAEDAEFTLRFQAEFTGRDVPAHVRQAILTLLASSPKKNSPGDADERNKASGT